LAGEPGSASFAVVSGPPEANRSGPRQPGFLRIAAGGSPQSFLARIKGYQPGSRDGDFSWSFMGAFFRHILSMYCMIIPLFKSLGIPGKVIGRRQKNKHLF